MEKEEQRQKKKRKIWMLVKDLFPHLPLQKQPPGQLSLKVWNNQFHKTEGEGGFLESCFQIYNYIHTPAMQKAWFPW